jgi:hypothetical protein
MNLWIRRTATQKTEYIILFRELLYLVVLEEKLCVLCVREAMFRETIVMMIFVLNFRICIRDENLNPCFLLLLQ